MTDFINVNETIREDDAATVQAAISLAHEKGLTKVVVPRYNARTKSTKWSFPRAVQLPSNTTVILDNCYIEQGLGAYDNLFCSLNAHEKSSKDPRNKVRNIAVIGEGNVILSGGEHNHCLEKTQRHYDLPYIWRNPIFFIKNVDGWRLENVHIQHQRWWAVNHIFTQHAVLKNLDFYAIPHVPNLDGIDLRIGCTDFVLENITGRTGDDVVAFTALAGRGEVFHYVDGAETNIRDVKLRNIKADSNTCYPFRLLNHDGNKLYNIDCDTIMDSSDPDSGVRAGAALSIGSPFYAGIFTGSMGDTYGINVRNIYTRAMQGIIINHTLKDTVISNVHTFKDNLRGIYTMIDGVTVDNVTVDHLYYGADQPKKDDGSDLERENYVGAVLSFPSLHGTLKVKHVEANPVQVGIAAKKGGTIEAEDVVFEDVYKEISKDEETKVKLNGEWV